MKLLKGYYVYLAVAGGFLLSFAAKDNWALQMLAYGLVSAGALSLQGVSRWYMRCARNISTMSATPPMEMRLFASVQTVLNR